MKTVALYGFRFVAHFLALCLVGLSSPSASAIPSFTSVDWRLPNPDRPYEMTSGTVDYGASLFALYDLKFQVANPTQLDTPSLRSDGRLEFDSTFDITYQAVISRGLEPPHPVTGIGTARAVGITRPDTTPFDSIYYLQVFDTELISLNLYALSPIPEVMFRESPTLRSSGVTIREDQCPVCAAPFTRWNISSFFDVFTEVSFNGGINWYAASDFIHVEQAPDGFPPGDYNKDKVVDAADFVVWRHTFGQIGAGLAADGDWSGEVDSGDYDVWRANFGQTAGSGSGRQYECRRARTGHLGVADFRDYRPVPSATPGHIESPESSSMRETGHQSTGLLKKHSFRRPLSYMKPGNDANRQPANWTFSTGPHRFEMG